MLRRMGSRHQQLKRLLKFPRLVSTSDSVAVSSERTFASAALGPRRSILTQRSDASVVGGSLTRIFGSPFSAALNQREADADDAESVTAVPRTAAAYERRMQRLLRSGPVSKVIKLFDEMKAEDLEPNRKAYTLMMRAHAREGDLPMVEKVFNEMQDSGLKPDTIAYNTYLNAFTKTKDVATALELFEKMRKEVQLTSISFRTIVNVCGKGKDLEKAKELFAEMMESYNDSDIRNFNVMVNAYAECVTEDTAEEYHEEGLKLFNDAKSQGIDPDIHTYAALMRLSGRGGLKKEALEHLAEAKQLKEDKRLTFYDILIECIGEMKLSDEELQSELVSVFKHMDENNIKPSGLTYESLLSLFAKKGEFDKALGFLNALEDEGVKGGGSNLGARLRCLEELEANGTNSPEETKKLAQEVLQKAKIAGSLSYPGYRAWLHMCKTASDVEQATEMWKTITMDRRKIDDDIIETMIELNLEHGKVADAMDFFLYMKDNRIQPTDKMFQMFLDHFAEHGDKEKATEAIEKLEASGIEPNEHLQELMKKLESV